MYILSKATLADIPELLEIETESFKYDRLGYFGFYYQIKQDQLYIARFNDCEVAGYISLKVREYYIYIASLAVKKSHRKKNLARFLLSFAEVIVLRTKLHCKRSLIKFYKKLGYKQIGIKYDYYTDGSDAITMEKDLTCQEAGQD